MIVDIEKIFKQYVTDHLVKNKGKIDGNKLQEVTDELYSSFQDTAFEDLEGLTPNTYYDNKTDCLEVILAEHVDSGIKINDYLIDALKRNLSAQKTVELVNNKNAKLVEIGLQIANFNGAKIDDNRLIDLLFDINTTNEAKELCALILKDREQAIDLVIDKCLTENCVAGVVCDLIAGNVKNYEKVTNILIDALNNNLDNVPEYCTYISKHGDSAALDTLYALAKSVTDKVSHKEICITIEILGGDLVDAKA